MIIINYFVCKRNHVDERNSFPVGEVRVTVAVRDISELKNDIIKLKESMATAVLVHSYQEPDLADVADSVGDCMELAAALERDTRRRAVVCGVRYVAEIISLLCPDRKIILSHPQARCPMSGQVYPGRVRSWREEHPDTCVVCSTHFGPRLMAECDLCITQNNALKVLEASKARKMLLLTDCNLGAWLRDRLPDKEIELWPCSCPAMSGAQAVDVELCRIKWPDCFIAANGALRPEVTSAADLSGSTAQIVDYCAVSEGVVIVADEVSVCSALRRRYPEKEIYQLAPSKLICSNMKLTDLETLERAIKGDFGAAVINDPALAERALIPLRRMMQLADGQV